MRKRALLLAVFSLAFLLVIIPEAFNNQTQPPTGYTGAPGEATCSAAGCHVSTPVNNRGIFRMDILSRPVAYDTAITYNLFVNNSAGTPMYGFEVTAIDANGNRAGNFVLNSTTTTSLNTAANGRQYVGHNNANSTNAWAFKWKPTAFVGPVTFYIAGLGANNNGTVLGDQTYLDTLIFSGQGQPANINADFSISNSTVCIGDPVTFTNTSTGTITTYSWNFGAGATPGVAATVGPHSVTYGTAGTKTITLTVGDGTLTNTETKTITVVAAPVADAGAPQTICAGRTVTLTASGGANYSWSNNAGNTANVTVSPLITTTYTVTVTSGSCSSTDNVTITVNPAPVADAGPNDTVCFGQPSTLTATGGVSYLWNTGSQTATTTGTLPIAGSFVASVTVTDANGCVAVDTARAVALALPVVNVPDVTTCGTGTATLDAGPGFTAYLWSNTDATQTTTVSASGTYTVTVTDANGCQNAASGDANIVSSLIVTVADAAICPGGSATLDAGYPGATYLWSNSATSRTITVTIPGTYSVTVTDGSCSGNDAAVVTSATLPPVGAGADATICAGDAIILGTADSVDLEVVQNQTFNACSLPTGWQANILAGTANWSFSIPAYGGTGGINNTCLAHYNDDDAGNQVNRLELLSPGFDATGYSVLLVNLDVHFRKFDTSQFSIQVWDGAAYQPLALYTNNTNGTTWASFRNETFDLAPYANTNLHLRFFYDDLGGYEWWAGIDNFLIVGVPNNVYSWSPTAGVANPTSPITVVRPLSNTAYVLTATANGCSKSDTIVVTVNQSPTVTLSGIAANYCENVNNDFTLTGTPSGGTFSGPGVTGNQFNPADAGVGAHDVVYAYFDSGLGCTGRDTITVTVEPIPTLTFQSITSYYCVDEPAITLAALPAGGTFSGPGVSGGQFNPTAVGAGTHTITYSYTSPAGCSNTVTYVYNVIDFEPTITNFGSSYCASDNTPITLTATPAGGNFSGPGVTGGVFNPSLAGPGLHDVTYAYDSVLGYTVNANFAFNVVSPANTPVQYTFADDDEELSTAIPIGFNFNFFGQDYSQLLVSTNGFITFNTATNTSAFTNQVLPNAAAPNNLVALMWDDLELSDFEYFVSGTAPNRSFVINFTAFHFFSPSVVNAQLVLQETTNEITINCISCQADALGELSTQGIENATGTAAFVVPGRNNTNWSSAGGSVRFTPASCTFTTVQQVTVSGVSVDVADTSICEGESVTITASGTASYLWNNGESTASITVSPSDTTIYTVTGNDGTCISSATATVNIREDVVAGINGISDTVCSADVPVVLAGDPTGGVFSGVGIIGNTFYPNLANVNTDNTITYIVSNVFGCTDTAELEVYASPSPNAQITLATTEYCLSALPVTLTAAPAGGTFTGPGISNGTFVPYFAGVGVHNLIYRVAVTGGCDAVDTISVTVFDLPIVTFDPISQQYCVQSDSVLLVGSPVGGVFSGPGVNAEYFNPAIAGIGGPFIVSYTYVDSNGCSSNNVQLTEVVSNPILQWVGLTTDYCANEGVVALQALPGGGTFSGTGVTGSDFDPTTAGAGTHTLSYTYTDGAGCDATIDAIVTVHGVLPIGIDNLDSTYCVNAPYVILSAFPAGGVFSGIGVVGDVFSPDTSGTGGPYTITYTYTDTNGCVTSASATTRIKPATNLLLSGLDPTYCSEDDIQIPITVAPTGGILLGSGVTGSSFNPSQAGAGSYVISYEYDNNQGCTSYAYSIVEVAACTGIDEVEDNIQIGLYPNPTTGLLNFGVTGLDGKDVTATVFSIHGQRLMTQQYNQVNSTQSLQLDMATLATGTYMVQVQAGNYSSVHRVVVSK